MTEITQMVITYTCIVFIMFLVIVSKLRDITRQNRILHHKIETLMSVADDIKALAEAQGTVITEIVTDTNAMLEIIAGAGTDAEKLAQVKATLEGNNAKLIEIASKFTPTPAPTGETPAPSESESPVEG